MLAIMTFSESGYIRLMRIRESKQLNVFAQINLQDCIHKVIPLYTTQDTGSERRLAVITQRRGVQIVTLCADKEFFAMEQLTQLMSHRLPFRGGMTPLHALIEPTMVQCEISPVNQFMNSGAVDLTNSLGDFRFLASDIQESLASECGFTARGLNDLLN
jgi:hypothetical protein